MFLPPTLYSATHGGKLEVGKALLKVEALPSLLLSSLVFSIQDIL
jgi:hypothetical protein